LSLAVAAEQPTTAMAEQTLRLPQLVRRVAEHQVDPGPLNLEAAAALVAVVLA
jgi:hypothetical protein